MAYMIIKKLFLLRVEPPSLLLCQRSWAVGADRCTQVEAALSAGILGSGGQAVEAVRLP